jgi:Mrp family chromosome partitioning ATPase/capsular polysaccharide biosynthesis protein
MRASPRASSDDETGMETQITTQPRISQPRLSDYIRPLTSRWWMVLVAVVVATGGVYAFYARKPNVYTTSTLVYVTQPGNPVTGVQAAPPTDRDVADAAALLDSRANAAVVARKIGYTGTPDDLLGQVSISSKPNEDFVQITAQSGSARAAAAIANAFAVQFVAALTNSYVTQLRDAIRLAQVQLAHTPPGSAGQVSSADLVNQINTLQVELGVPTTIAKQTNPAQPPTSPSSPKPVRNALFAFLLSLVGAIALAYGLERFNRRLRNPEELENAYEVPLLAVLPHADDPAPILDGSSLLSGDFREPFRVLRTNVELASVDAPPRTIVVSSAMPGEGKSTVVRNLALAFHEAGKRVAVVDLDLRHPALAAVFGVAIGPGMTDVLRRDLKLEDVMLEIGTGIPSFDEFIETNGVKGNGANGHHAKAADAGVTLLLGGAPPANPPAVLASHRVAEILDDLRGRYDIVLIDSAPLLAVSDTVPLLRYADAALFVGRLGVTTRDTAKRLTEFLARVPDVTVLGLVANDLSRLEAGAYGYAYGYGYGYGSSGKETKRDRRRRKATAEPPKQTV